MCNRVDVLEMVVLEEIRTLSLPSNPVESFLIGNYGNGVGPHPDEEREVYERILNSTQPYLPRQQAREVLNVEVLPSNEDKKSAPEVELKPLPSHLKYEFLGLNHKFPVIISAKLSGVQIEKLLSVLQKYRGAIDYSIDDIKGIIPSFCMHLILLDDGHRPSRQPQRRLNPNMQEVERKSLTRNLMPESFIQAFIRFWIVIGLA